MQTEDSRIVRYWSHLRTAGALLQATKEAIDLLKHLPGKADAEEVYIRQDAINTSDEVSLFLCENVLTDGSLTYDIQIR